MSQIGNYDMSFPGLSVGGGSSSGTSSGSSSGSGTSKQSTQMVPGMLNVYSQLLGLNQQNYGNMKGAYQSQLAGNAQTLPGIYQGYNSLQGNVMDTLGLSTNGQPNGSFGVAAPAAQQIQNTYQQGVAGNTQQMASAGLGNTTVGANLNAQAAQQAGLSLGQLGSSLAQTAAGYQSQIGQAGLGAQMTGLQTQTGLTQAALNPLDTQYANTAGTLTGGFGESSYSNNSTQKSQQGSQQQQGGNTGASGQDPAGNVTGAPGGPAGGGSGGGGAPSGPGAGVNGTNPYSANTGNNTSTNVGPGSPYSNTPPAGPGGPSTLTPTSPSDPSNPYGPDDGTGDGTGGGGTTSDGMDAATAFNAMNEGGGLNDGVTQAQVAKLMQTHPGLSMDDYRQLANGGQYNISLSNGKVAHLQSGGGYNITGAGIAAQ